MTQISLTLAQINPTVGALHGNAEIILGIWEAASTDLIIFPELCVCGYPPEDLVLKPAFIDEVKSCVERICEKSKTFKSAALIGCPWRIDGQIYNAALLIEGGKIILTQAKHDLPNYGVFDECRVFAKGALPDAFTFRGVKIGIAICEDLWFPQVAAHLKSQGAQILLVPNASPYEISKDDTREDIAKLRTRETGLPIVYVNQIGGQDEIVFDGASFVMSADGEIVFQMPEFEEGTLTCHLDRAVASGEIFIDCQQERSLGFARDDKDGMEELYNALVLGLRDYVRKNGFPGILLGLSGGIDSAISAVIAAEAVGAQNVQCVMMPSRFTSQDSLDDAKAQAENLGCPYMVLSIAEPMAAFEGVIPSLANTAHENMQSRTRGLILMALSNSNGKMLLSTGNKSEMAVGYATLYGDMCGGFNALKDLYKTEVYALSRWINREREIIPTRIITKAPTAELKDNQTDQDSLPAYDVLDDILQCLIEHEMDVSEIAKRGHDAATINRVWAMLDRAEYKRRQAPPGVKVTSRAFGRDRRYPITNKFGKE